MLEWLQWQALKSNVSFQRFGKGQGQTLSVDGLPSGNYVLAAEYFIFEE